MDADLIVCGLGPAGRALAHRAARRGLSVIAIDPQPERRWRATYAAWADEVPDWLEPRAVAAVTDRPRARGTRWFTLSRPYSVFDTAALQDSLDLTGVRVLTDRVTGIERPDRIRTDSGAPLTAHRIVDARGLARRPDRAEQTAYGIVLRGVAPTVFMDWLPDNGAPTGEAPSFLYTLDLGNGTTLYEETCLAGRPGLGIGTLRRRLEYRLRSRAVAFDAVEATERVRFALEGGTAREGRFGAAGALLHPATGYSVGAALSAADAVAAGQPLWPAPARAAHALRRAGLRALLALPPHDVAPFFDTFFGLTPARQRAYLSGRTDLRGTAAAMTALFGALPWRQRRILMRAATGPHQR
ncbi:lycopene cyclase family protein [Nocardia nova SH22a]|uniref:Lycopene cyclase family protein n=1 Tax=Nocardia nova SH22a TaxID=1415166 RepID=W5THY3_9NOCA|nr:lycopene cyclase family protein [Nocardia nova]AHH18940.1 lycopene cyclase family protein [Nocardia nova SH22a]